MKHEGTPKVLAVLCNQNMARLLGSLSCDSWLHKQCQEFILIPEFKILPPEFNCLVHFELFETWHHVKE